MQGLKAPVLQEAVYYKYLQTINITTLELHVRKIQWFCQQGEGFCMHVFSSFPRLFTPGETKALAKSKGHH